MRDLLHGPTRPRRRRLAGVHRRAVAAARRPKASRSTCVHDSDGGIRRRRPARRPTSCCSTSRLPGDSGFEVCRRLKQNDATRLTPVVLLTGLSRPRASPGRHRGRRRRLPDQAVRRHRAHRARAVAVAPQALHRRTRVGRIGDRQPGAHRRGARRLHRRPLRPAVELRGRRSGEHLGLSDDDLSALRRGGLLHDVGKVGIPDAVLLKPGRLTPRGIRAGQAAHRDRRAAVRGTAVAGRGAADHPPASRAARRLAAIPTA